jgi:hypothetical protein
MAAGDNNTAVLVESLDDIAASARSRREYEAVIPQLVESVTLNPNSGTSWKELLYEQINAAPVTETSVNDNFQQFDDSSISITPQMVQIATFVTDKAKRNLSPLALAQMGALAGNAMMRRQDEDGLVALDGSTTQLGTANQPLTTSIVAAARYRITSNATEHGGTSGIAGVFHGFVLKDFYDELSAGIGTYPVPEGSTARVFTGAFNLPIAQVMMNEDGNITPDGDGDAKNFVFAREAWILVRGMSIRTELERLPRRGGGGDAVIMTDEWAYGERSAGNWSYELIGDATAPS